MHYTLPEGTIEVEAQNESETNFSNADTTIYISYDQGYLEKTVEILNAKFTAKRITGSCENCYELLIDAFANMDGII